MLLPEIVVLTDAVQLASQPGKLPTAVMTLKHRFPGALLWTPGLGGPTTWASWCPWALTCLISHDAARRQPMAFSSRHGGLAFPSSMRPRRLRHRPTTCSRPWMKSAAVNSGTLRSLADRQSQSSPRLVEHLRRHQELAAKHRGNLASHMPAATEFPCFSPNALNDPLVVDWERFIVEHYETPHPVRDVDFASLLSRKAPTVCQNLTASSSAPLPRPVAMKS